LSAGAGSAAGGWLAGAGMPALLARIGAGALAGGVVNTGMQVAVGDRFSWTSMAESATVTALGAGVGPKLGSLLSRLLARSTAETDEFVNLASQARTMHILDGEIRPDGSFGGGHRAGTGFPVKSEFPADWSDARIMHHISDVATDPYSTFNPGRGGDIWATGTRQRVDIAVLLRSGEIWTGYPTNLPLNPPR
jgi:filamentous hemagglutinin